ncbi:MAG: methyltransferase [Bdellovibrionales bacterium]|nr:methyltransferase [Bdellovibrionales bacterium]
MPSTLEICRTSFDEIAKLYDEARPCYPQQLVKDVFRHAELPIENPKILEIGSGTGKATENFVFPKCEFHCIEPGLKSIKIARNKLASFKNLHFTNARFEEWNNPGEKFDLVISGQAFHWLDVDLGLVKVADVLKVNACFALFWNTLAPDSSDLDIVLDQIYHKYVPFLSRNLVESLPDETIIELQTKLRNSGKFERVITKRYTWTIDYSAKAYINLMKTFTDVHLLSDGIKKALLERIETEIENSGGVYTKTYRAVLLVAKKVTDIVN